MRKLVVLYPVLHYPPVIGGLEQWEQNIAENQPDNVRVVVVTGRVRGLPKFEEKGNVVIFRNSFFELTNLSYSSPLYILTTFCSIFFHSRRLTKEYEIDLFHCHGFLSAVIGYVLSFITKKPFIGTEQSLGWAVGPMQFLRSIVYKKAAVCMASSSAVVEEFHKREVWNVTVIPNGVDLSGKTVQDRLLTLLL